MNNKEKIKSNADYLIAWNYLNDIIKDHCKKENIPKNNKIKIPEAKFSEFIEESMDKLKKVNNFFFPNYEADTTNRSEIISKFLKEKYSKCIVKNSNNDS